ncbi:Arm DNA-binding domain-containing protein [Novibacillus thermophilus]|uniref:AP2-like integrase N-terminal domain-containing protein n=1 Tax=Novibacillus thermophilus TaxID=1471761 RepID=A0A1U9KAD7_9BACL|nr:Arm DNA-binding domain-containing protein [Novibacillus thermophilus]AQS57027.1 hypothetical protein B0W44_15980 [Novibacillus thermophilus]
MRGHIRKRGNKWCFVLDVGIDEETGKRKQKWFSGYRTSKEAERAMIATIKEINEGTFIEPSKEKLGDYMIKWLNERKDSLRETTYTNYRHYPEFRK